jgi:general secretion pathway protein D
MIAEVCRSVVRCALLLVLGIVLASCSSLANLRSAGSGASVGDALGRGAAADRLTVGSIESPGPQHEARARKTVVELGASASASVRPADSDPGLARIRVSLNFVDTDVREFARVLFSELLQRPYVVDQGVAGAVTVRSGGDIDGETALSLAREALKATANTIAVRDGIYRVSSLQGAQFDPSGTVKSFSLQYIDAAAAQAALAGLIQGRAETVSAVGDTLVLRGDRETLELIGSLIGTIDIDRFKTSSFGLFPLEVALAGDVSQELQALFAGVGVAPQTLLPIERINALLVITSRGADLEFAQKWIARLDEAAQPGRQMFTYRLRNRNAEDVARLMQDIFADGVVTASASSSPGGAPFPEQSSVGVSTTAGGSPRITADSGSNTLVIWARREEYDVLERALVRLDQPLDQVYVEATIAEVRLNGALSHGVRWFFEANGLSAGLSDAGNGAIASTFPGFNFTFRVPQAQLVVSALEAATEVRIVATPQVTVVDRATATIQVGDQVPIVTKTVQDTGSGANIIANDVTFRDTGVILKVTPQIRSSGEVLLAIEQEVSRVVPTTSSQINSPTISQRKIESTVLVPDGTAIVLAGLISSSHEDGNGGLPGTGKTLLGALFGSSESKSARSELVVIIRPIVVRDRSDLRDVVEEVAGKMRDVMQVELD